MTASIADEENQTALAPELAPCGRKKDEKQDGSLKEYYYMLGFIHLRKEDPWAISRRGIKPMHFGIARPWKAQLTRPSIDLTYDSKLQIGLYSCLQLSINIKSFYCCRTTRCTLVSHSMKQ